MHGTSLLNASPWINPAEAFITDSIPYGINGLDAAGETRSHAVGSGSPMNATGYVYGYVTRSGPDPPGPSLFITSGRSSDILVVHFPKEAA